MHIEQKKLCVEFAMRKKRGPTALNDERVALAVGSVELPANFDKLFSRPNTFVNISFRCQVDDALVECENAVKDGIVEISILDSRRASEKSSTGRGRIMSDSLRFNYKCVENRMRAHLRYMQCIEKSFGADDETTEQNKRLYAHNVEAMLDNVQSFLEESIPSARATATSRKHASYAILSEESDDSEIEDMCRRVGEITTDSEAERCVALSSGIIGGDRESQFVLSDDD